MLSLLLANFIIFISPQKVLLSPVFHVMRVLNCGVLFNSNYAQVGMQNDLVARLGRIPFFFKGASHIIGQRKSTCLDNIKGILKRSGANG